MSKRQNRHQFSDMQTNRSTADTSKLTENEVETILKNARVSVSERAKQASLNQARQGIHEARSKKQTNRSFRKIGESIGALVAVSIAAVFIVVLMTNGDDHHSDFAAPGNASESNVTDVQGSDNQHEQDDGHINDGSINDGSISNDGINNGGINDDLGNDNNNDATIESDPEWEADIPQSNATRPETKEITVYPEGMEEERTYQLLDEDYLPFTTYFPVNWEHEPIRTNYGDGVHLITSTDAAEQVDAIDYIGRIDIVFFEDGTDEDEAMRTVQEMVSALPEDTVRFPRDEALDEALMDWIVLEVAYTDPHRSGKITLGEHEGTYFSIHHNYYIEAADGWGPLEMVLIDEWRWNETDQPLVKRSADE